MHRIPLTDISVNLFTKNFLQDLWLPSSLATCSDQAAYMSEIPDQYLKSSNQDKLASWKNRTCLDMIEQYKYIQLLSWRFLQLIIVWSSPNCCCSLPLQLLYRSLFLSSDPPHHKIALLCILLSSMEAKQRSLPSSPCASPPQNAPKDW